MQAYLISILQNGWVIDESKMEISSSKFKHLRIELAALLTTVAENP